MHEEICPVCGAENSFTVEEREDTRTVKGEEFVITVAISTCGRCKEEFLPLSGDEGFEKAKVLYRTKHGMVAPERLKAWRESLGLTQESLALVMKWGTATVSRYENGKLAEPSHDQALSLAMNNAEALLGMVTNADGLPDSTQKSLIDQLRHKVWSETVEKAFLQDAVPAPNETIQIEKIANIVMAFCDGWGEFETKLNKLLFYADFKYFKDFGKTLTGLSYVRHHYGPVPSNYRLLYSWLEKRDLIKFEEEVFDTFVGYRATTVGGWDKNIFTEQELEVLLAVKNRFKKLSATKISELSHEEFAWKETDNGSVISYDFANILKAI